MKTKITTLLKSSVLMLACLSTGLATAQTVSTGITNNETGVANLRAYDQSGINVFDSPKDTNAVFTGLKVKFGAGFTQSFQGLKHENTSTLPANALYKISPGFNTANANLFMDVQLADGIRLNLTSYLSSRHHNETWVKGGYIQFDKLPFKGKIWDEIMKVTTIKVGHMEINYGDQHFRRTDGGQSLYNPFIENNIMDAFTTEIGGEVLVRKNSLFGLVGVSNGMIKGNIEALTATPADANTHKSPAFFFKGGYDKQLTTNVRVRVAASYYTNQSSAGQTLYAGDRTGSNYYMTMEKAIAVPAVVATPEVDGTPAVGTTPAVPAKDAVAFVPAVKSSTGAQFSSGRFDPSFKKKVEAIMLNGFVKAYGLELFGTYEIASGRTAAETVSRNATQIAIDAVYRFGKTENLFVGARYNTVKSDILVGVATQEININRTAFAAGWFLTKNVMLKGEYVKQQYKDFAVTDYRSGGKFNGYVIQAVVGF